MALMEEVYWSLGRQKFDDYAGFVSEVNDYNNEIGEGDSEWNADAIVCHGPCNITYDDEVEIVVSSKSAPITMGKLLFEVNQQGHEFFEDRDDHFFEGIEEMAAGHYELVIGS